MIVKVQISKTWQEKQYEPFNVSLGIETTSDDELSIVELRKLMKDIASEMQDTADEIFADRKGYAR